VVNSIAAPTPNSVQATLQAYKTLALSTGLLKQSVKKGEAFTGPGRSVHPDTFER